MTNKDLKYHFHPEKGWLNDPNGLSYFNGKYQIFYQYIQGCEYPGTQPAEWGHAVTENFIDFEELPVAIRRGNDYDRGGVWSGTAVEKDGKLYAFYASVSAENRQMISMAVSEDGINFEKYEKNPIIRDYPCNNGGNFRDPAVMIEDGTGYMVVASADYDRHTGLLLLYKSENLFDWEYVGTLKEYPNTLFCECPSFVKHGDGYILACSVMISMDNNVLNHYFEVMYGQFDGKIFTPEITSHFQKGPDEYAGQIFRAPDGRSILMSWVSGWQYAPKEKCIGCLSLPLEVIVSDGKIKAYPIKEVRHLLDENDTVTDAYVKETFAGKGESVYIELLEKP